MTILITGGSGFIGKELSKILLGKKHEVVLFDMVPPQEQEKGGEKLPYVRGNISDWAEVCNVIQEWKVEHIFHLAAMLSAQCEANPWAAVQVNGLGIYHILEASRLFGVRKVIFTSFMGAYGPVQNGFVSDDTLQRPQIMYGVTKVFGELLGVHGDVGVHGDGASMGTFLSYLSFLHGNLRNLGSVHECMIFLKKMY
jgi:nucleoside-diphosphate-sugar epimerase